MTLERRTFLKMMSAAALAQTLPGCIRDAMMIPAHSEKQSLEDVSHVVILLQENRAFDHYFGTMRGVRGFGDRFTIPVQGAPTVFHQKSGSETILPYHLDSTIGNAQRVDGTPHSFLDAQLAYDNGRMSQWPTFKQQQSMGHYTQQELEFQFALAEAFTICDAYHCGIHSSTNPNRLFAFTGTNGSAETGGPATSNSHDLIGPAAAGYTWKTYAERLEAAGVSWKIYQDFSDNFSDNPLVGFASFREAFFDDHDSPLYTKALTSNVDGADLTGLRDDVLAGTLPSVSWIIGPATYSEHPGPSSPVQGAYYVQQVLEALTANPEVFSKTVLLVTFDENDGFFDHVPPPSAPTMREDGTLVGGSTVSVEGEHHDGGVSGMMKGAPYGPGMRVPMWVVSPWSRGGWVCSETFDHTSILRFLEERFGVRSDEISDYRRAICGDLRSAFDFLTPNEDPFPALPTQTQSDADMLRAAQEMLAAVPVPTGSAGTMPVQAPGTRPSRRLPYVLSVEAAHKGGELELRFRSLGDGGAVFHVYDRNQLSEIPRRYAVASQKSLKDTWPADAYDLWVLGPNGFHRHFVGAATIDASVELEYDIDAKEIVIRCASGTGTAFLITDRAYGGFSPLNVGVAPGKHVDTRLEVATTVGWYDVEVTILDEPSFSRRFAGRMENGEHSVSDPAMGAP